MLLAIDIGNTNIKAGIFDRQKLLDHFIASDFRQIINSLSPYNITAASISSVVPEKTKSIYEALKNSFDCKPFIITKNVKFNLDVNYKTPETLGIDRLCSVEGALLSYKNLNKGTYLITIDFGTATTINIVKYPKIFIGGLISPGIKTLFQSLDKQTSQLPELTIDKYDSFIGDDTLTSIASGVVNSTIGLIEKTVQSLLEFSDCKEVIVYATGGMASKLRGYLMQDIVYDKYLVLRGISAIYALNKN
ncbi:MAG: type III pantothenate kinase [Ignavibacteria bacterium]|nr:MAG: type III pantothenate kinase [Ignavibacteria bacterium]